MIGFRGRTIVFAMSTLLLLSACSSAIGSSPSAEASAPTRLLIGDTGNGYSEASVYGDLVWTAGHLPFRANSADPFESQVEVVLDDLEATLEKAGAGFDTLLKTNVYLMSFDDWEAFNAVYVSRIGKYGLPPRTTVQVAGLGLGRIEIEMVAHVRTP